MSKIVARQHELAILQRLYESPKAEFLAVYGRRRVGKTYLISEFYKDKGVYFEVTGTRDASKAEQLRKYHREFSKLFINEESQSEPKDWDTALFRLSEAISKIDPQKKVILFFDELPWLVTPRSGLLKELEYYWNRHFSRMNNVLLIICGSAAAWMIHHVIRNKGGLYGRLSQQINLQPFTLYEVEQYFQSQSIELDRKQIALLYMIMGGVAKYLSFIRRGLSATQLIDELCFSPQGLLLSEFNDLYHSLFDKAEEHIAIVKTLAKVRHGMTRDVLIKAIQKKSGGNISKIIEELEESGFIISFRKFQQKTRDKQIRLFDEYSHFYLDFISDIKNDVVHHTNGNYWQSMQAGSRWKAWSGHAFESICLKHIKQIKKALGISGVNSSQSQWHYRAESNDEHGVQIDLLIDRSDHCINLVEVKFSDIEFVITKEYAKKLELKKQIFKQKTKTKKTVFFTMITPYGVKKNQYYLSIVDNQLTLDDMFAI